MPAWPAATYLLLLAYGTLYPLRGWTTPASPPLAQLLSLSTYQDTADFVTNLLVYVPAGALLAGWLWRRLRLLALPLAVLLCAGVSGTLEWTQAYLPGRVTSGVDWLLNTAGTTVGASMIIGWLWLRVTPPLAGLHLHFARAVRSDRTAPLGLAVVAVWLAAHWAPFVPTLDVAQLLQSLAPVRATLTREAGLDWLRLAQYTVEVGCIGLVLTSLLRNPVRSDAWLLALIAALWAGQLLVVGQAVSVESVLGALGGWMLNATWSGRWNRGRRTLAMALAVMALLLGGLQWPPAPTPSEFNWVPFHSHLRNPLRGVESILAIAWPYLGLAYLIHHARRRSPRSRASLPTLGAVLALGLLIEWLQRWLPGRTADVTDVLVGALAWLLIHILALQRDPRRSQRPATDTANREASLSPDEAAGCATTAARGSPWIQAPAQGGETDKP